MSKVIAFVLMFGVMFGAFTAFVQWLFNAVSSQFGGPQLGFWLTMGCLVLLNIVGGAFRHVSKS